MTAKTIQHLAVGDRVVSWGSVRKVTAVFKLRNKWFVKFEGRAWAVQYSAKSLWQLAD